MLPKSYHLSCYCPREVFYLTWVGHSAICLLSTYPAILNVQSSLCSKSLKPSVRSSSLSSPSPTSRRRPLGSAVVHSYYTPTRVVEDFEVVARALKYSHQAKTASERWILPMYIFLISRCSSAVYCSRLLFIVIWHGSTVYLIGSHGSDLSRAWVCPPRWDIWYFCRWHFPIPDSWAHSFSTSVQIGKELVMYFGHQMLFWPHTLGGICYNPKMHHTGLPGIRPTHASS